MVRKSFGRSLSFPIPTPATSNIAARKINGRGSASLPSRFHPFVSHLEDEIQDLLTWQAQSSQARPDRGARVLDGLARLDRLHSSLDDLLQHPQARDPLRRRSPWTALLLDDFLRFADAYGSFRSAIVALNDCQSATQSAIRRSDESRIASCAREQRRAEKELLRIAAAVRSAGRWGSPAASVHDAAEASLAGVMREVVSITAAVSAAAIAGIAELSAVGSAFGAPPSCGSLKGSMCLVGSMMLRLGSVKKKEEGKSEEKWMDEALKSLEALEECIAQVEKTIERLFKSLVNSRVFLLNVLSPSL